VTADAARAEVLRAHGAGGAETAELLAYGPAPFAAPEGALAGPYPLADEPFAAAWEGYAAEAAERGAWPVLREKLVQLRFPIAAGMSASDGYRRATLRGDASGIDDEAGMRLAAPERLRVFLHPTAAGRVPVVAAGAREDFEALVRALARRNEPDPVPASMGACFVAGLPNWDRVAAHRRAWEAASPDGDWSAEFRAMIPRRELYQDRLVLLGRGPYSGVAAARVGRPEEAWLEESLAIRLEHECAHYFTRRVHGSLGGTLRDELVADFMGITAAADGWRPEWLLRFLGLEDFPAYRAGGRLENYRGAPPLSDSAFRVLQSLVHAAASHLGALAGPLPPRGDVAGRARLLGSLASLSLEEMAAGVRFAREQLATAA